MKTDPHMKLHLIALNEPFSGSQGGIRGADFACFKESRRAGLRGTYRALLAGQNQDLDTIVHASHRSGVRVVNLSKLNSSHMHDRGSDILWSRRLLGQSSVPCNMPLIVLCVEVLAN